MKKISLKKANSLRKTRNQEILWRMENGESLTSFNSHASWFPPRPTVEKDEKAVKQLYGTKPDARLSGAAKAEGSSDQEKPAMNLKLAQ